MSQIKVWNAKPREQLSCGHRVMKKQKPVRQLNAGIQIGRPDGFEMTRPPITLQQIKIGHTRFFNSPY